MAICDILISFAVNGNVGGLIEVEHIISGNPWAALLWVKQWGQI